MNAVLLVDDERDFADMLAGRLSARGFPVRTAYDGEEALRLAAAEEPEVAVLDIGLPGMDGLTLLARLKRLRPAMEALVLTGSNDLATAVTGMKLGAADYLVKPASLERLTEAIGRAFARRRERLESLRMAETAKMAALGHMAEGVAHEINNPVNTMASLAGWLGDLAADLRAELGGAPPQKTTDILGEMDASAAKLAEQALRVKAVTAKLLCLCHKSRPTALEAQPGGGERVELPRLVGELLAERAERMESAGVRAETTFETGMPSLSLPGIGLPGADLATALGNILDNALDAMPDGGALRIRVGRGPATPPGGPGGAIHIEISDTGPGIPPEILPRVFEPFFSTREVGRGTGLGLAVSYGTIKSLGGDIEADSEPGRGARFDVALPGG